MSPIIIMSPIVYNYYVSYSQGGSRKSRIDLLGFSTVIALGIPWHCYKNTPHTYITPSFSVPLVFLVSKQKPKIK